MVKAGKIIDLPPKPPEKQEEPSKQPSPSAKAEVTKAIEREETKYIEDFLAAEFSDYEGFAGIWRAIIIRFQQFQYDNGTRLFLATPEDIENFLQHFNSHLQQITDLTEYGKEFMLRIGRKAITKFHEAGLKEGKIRPAAPEKENSQVSTKRPGFQIVPVREKN